MSSLVPCSGSCQFVSPSQAPSPNQVPPPLGTNCSQDTPDNKKLKRTVGGTWPLVVADRMTFPFAGQLMPLFYTYSAVCSFTLGSWRSKHHTPSQLQFPSWASLFEEITEQDFAQSLVGTLNEVTAASVAGLHTIGSQDGGCNFCHSM